MAVSRDGVPISYECTGHGEPMLVFVHGWCCDARYWRKQVPEFSRTHRVVTLDLAGHGHSGMGRTNYTMRAFGEDVRVVAESAGCGRVVLIGHSMGGSVIAEAARLMPDRVIGLIGVDTLENVEYAMTPQEQDKMIAPLRADFRGGCRAFVGGMLSTNTESELREWILSDMSAAPQAVAVSAIAAMTGQYVTGEAANVFEAIRAPVIVVKGDLWPADAAANRRHMASFDVIELKRADHFLMLDRPDAFNAALETALQRVQSTAGGLPLTRAPDGVPPPREHP
jgi:pimeloyl-ACP methyl ester carboxylesterase